LIRQFEDQLVRLAMGKAPNVHFNPGVTTGKLSTVKVEAARDAWVRHMVRSLPGVDIIGKTGYTFTANPDEPQEKEEEVNLHDSCALRALAHAHND
jgi:hypothetical protein